MGRPCKPPAEKTCPKCGTKFETKSRKRFCSSKCAKTRERTAKQREEHSDKIRQWKQTEAGEDNSINIAKKRTVVVNFPHPDDPQFQDNHEVQDGLVWRVAEGWNYDEYGYY